jgi:hypothetical protein
MGWALLMLMCPSFLQGMEVLCFKNVLVTRFLLFFLSANSSPDSFKNYFKHHSFVSRDDEKMFSPANSNFTLFIFIFRSF